MSFFASGGADFSHRSPISFSRPCLRPNHCKRNDSVSKSEDKRDRSASVRTAAKAASKEASEKSVSSGMIKVHLSEQHYKLLEVKIRSGPDLIPAMKASSAPLVSRYARQSLLSSRVAELSYTGRSGLLPYPFPRTILTYARPAVLRHRAQAS